MYLMAKVEGGVVVNIAVTHEPEMIEPLGYITAAKGVGIGWLFDGEQFAPPPVEANMSDLTPRQFGWLLATFKINGVRFETVWDDLEIALADVAPDTYAELRAARRAGVFRHQKTVEMVSSLADVISQVAGAPVEIAELSSAWSEAAGH